MSNSAQLVTSIKQQLREQGISYRKLAKALSLSESAIKQMFSSGNMSLKRVDAICSVLKLDLTDLVESINNNEHKIERLSYSYEKELVGDLRLLLVAYCVVNHWSMETIVENYQISTTECIQYLAKLDRMKLIELLPGNRIRPLTHYNFKWIENGPIEKFFRTQVQTEFLASHFSGDDSIRICVFLQT
jgi:DNA-binding Xre family transcriptional regulator